MKWINLMKQLTSLPGIQKFTSPPQDWKKLSDYFAWYVTQLMMTKDNKPCYNYTPFSSSMVIPFTPSSAGGSANNPIPPAVTPRRIRSESDQESTERLLRKLRRIPFGRPDLQDINEIMFSTSWTKEQNAVAVRDAIEFLIFEELGGEFVNDTFSDPLIKSAVTVVDGYDSAVEVRNSLRMQNNNVIINSCNSNNCAAKVLVRSDAPTSSTAIDAAVDRLRTRDGFRNSFNEDPDTIWKKVIHQKNPQTNVRERYWQLIFQLLEGGSSGNDA